MTHTRKLSLALFSLTLAMATLPAVATGADDGPVAGWWVVRYDGRITESDRAALEGAGAEGLRYMPPNGYVAWLDAGVAADVGAQDGVAGVALLPPARKIDVALEDISGTAPMTVTVSAERRAHVARLLAAHGEVFRGFAAEEGVHDLYLLGSRADAEAAAALPSVLYVGPASSGLAPLDEMGDQIVAGNISGATVAPGYETWLASQSLDGSGVRVSVTDTGVDPHPDLRPRIVAEVDYSQSPTGEPVDSLGHGTHVAGIIGGDANGLNPATRARDSAGFLYGLGVAPKVQIVDQNVIATTAIGPFCGTFWPPAYPWSQLTQDALGQGAGIWNASWWSCEDARGNYIDTNRDFDALVRDADPAAAGDQPFTFVFSAGNNSAPRTVAAPASSKNLISVGSSETGRGGGNRNAISGFSSRGPAADGRILPTVAAPGGNVVSTRSYAGALACNVPAGADTLGLYASCSGTSMAAPHVTGAVALLTQWWRRSHDGADPSPALTKALLVNSATDMGTADIPNGNEGWGRVNLGNLFDPGAQRVVVDQTTVLDNLDETVTYTVTPADPSKPLKVTLAWTDAPGAAGASPALVNDLDLTVAAADGATYLGNRFSGGRSVTGGAPNRKDNLENVYLQSPAGSYTVSVSAFNLPEDGVPGVGDATDQDYVLVITNGVIAA